MTTRSTSRRKFLSAALRAAGLGLAAPAVVRSGALAAAEGASANDRVGVGFIGVGGMGSGHLGGYARDGRFPAVAVCDVDASKREAASRSVGAHCGAHNDYRELLDRKDVDAVVISVPDHWHALAAVHACEAGKDVYCEKPLSLTVRQARAMADAARRYGRIFQTGSQQRSSGEFLKACELVRSGRIGRVHTVHVGVWGTSRPCNLPAEETPPGLDWDRWIGPAPWRPFNRALHPFNWRAFREYSGGMMTDWGAHHLDIAQWGLGRDATGPVEVFPPGETVPSPVDPPQGQHVTYRYADGVIVRCGETGANGVQFIGEGGRITVNRGYFHADPEEAAAEPLGPGDLRLYQSPGHHEDWRRCIATRARPVADVEIGARSVTVCHLGNMAIWLGRKLQWDPSKEEIVGDPEASRWLDRPMRAPYHL
ncbi:MAG: Gfo/Idh/MocA family oxidoreductase [Planctomycetes bacterium]|nr:Gfo/Idh/MocA family oxidoreductase [Planctomycetota bacterium]